MLDSLDLFCIEKYKDNFNIWYRSDMMDSMNKVNFNEAVTLLKQRTFQRGKW